MEDPGPVRTYLKLWYIFTLIPEDLKPPWRAASKRRGFGKRLTSFMWKKVLYKNMILSQHLSHLQQT